MDGPKRRGHGQTIRSLRSMPQSPLNRPGFSIERLNIPKQPGGGPDASLPAPATLEHESDKERVHEHSLDESVQYSVSGQINLQMIHHFKHLDKGCLN